MMRKINFLFKIGIFGTTCLFLFFIFSNKVSAAAGESWTQVTSGAGWSLRQEQGTAVFNNKMWVMGGEHVVFPSATFLNDVWSSSDGENWTQEVANAPWSKRAGSSVVVFNNKMWLMGGITEDWVEASDVWYSSDGINWTQATDSAAWSEKQSVVVFNDKMWVIGAWKDVWYSSDGINWTQATDSAAWSARTEAGITVFNNKMWVMGGFDQASGDYLNDIWYTSDGINWTEIAHWPSPQILNTDLV